MAKQSRQPKKAQDHVTASAAVAAANGAANGDAGGSLAVETELVSAAGEAPKSVAERAYELFRGGQEADFPATWAELTDLERTGFEEAAARVDQDAEVFSNYARAVYAVLYPI